MLFEKSKQVELQESGLGVRGSGTGSHAARQDIISSAKANNATYKHVGSSTAP
jgi:hypothetical protein